MGRLIIAGAGVERLGPGSIAEINAFLHTYDLGVLAVDQEYPPLEVIAERPELAEYNLAIGRPHKDEFLSRCWGRSYAAWQDFNGLRNGELFNWGLSRLTRGGQYVDGLDGLFMNTRYMRVGNLRRALDDDLTQYVRGLGRGALDFLSGFADDRLAAAEQ